MFGTDSKSGITRRFRDVESDLPVETDDVGFIVPSLYSLTIEQILRASAVLVRGQSWTGKTYVANEIVNQQSTLKLGDYSWFQPLERHMAGRPLKPTEWDEWLGNEEKQACWIIDSVDEGELIQPNVYTEITYLLEQAGKRACRRLKLIMFARENDVPKELCEFLENHFGDLFFNVELLPLDRKNAERIVGTGRLDATLAAIRKYSLQSVAGYPAALEYISRHSSDSSLSEVAVWRGVLTELLRERSQSVARRQVPLQEPDHQFRAAAHLAVVMTFANVPRLSISSMGSGAPDVADLMSADPEPKGPTRAAARDALKTTMFHNGRFSQKNIREWMCAFGLANVGLSRLKRLITDSAGNLERKHFGVLSLLHKTTAFRDRFGDWLVESNGGVPPQSDVTLSFDEALAIIDRLESIADTAQWGIDVWGERGLNHLDTPGIGRELATRIADPSRSANRRELLTQIAIQTNSREVLPTVIALVQDCAADEDLFRTALEKLLSQDPPNDDDLNTLIPLALHDKYELYEPTRGVGFHAAFGRSTEARRKLFLAEIRRNARRKPENRRRDYIWILSSDDVEWLIERVVQLAAKDDSVWVELLRMARDA